MERRIAWPSFVFGLCLVTAACVGDDPASTGGAAVDGGPGGPGAEGGSPGSEGGPGANDGATGDGASCTPGTVSCVDGTTLATCGSAQKTTCAFDCSATGTAHCTVMQPNAPVTAADLATAGVVDVVITADAFLDTATGAIDNLRPANLDPTATELKSGIGFRRVGNVGVFTMKSLKVPDTVTLKLRGLPAVALVATETIEIVGVVDARAYDATGALCGSGVAGPGGSLGAKTTDANSGTAPGAGGGKGAVGSAAGGPGGGGFGGAGGAGGNFATSNGVAVPMPSPIAGGFGGGAAGSEGGAGGGALQLVAGTSITIGGGANPGGVNAGGCGGIGAAFGATGSGGGSGGALLLQSATVSVKAQGVLAANGGAGSTGNASARGEHGKLSASRALGPAAVQGYGKGGDGAAGAVLDGDPGGPNSGAKGGGGAGAVGRIRIENRSGSISLPSGAIITPVIGVGTTAATTVGTVGTK